MPRNLIQMQVTFSLFDDLFVISIVKIVVSSARTNLQLTRTAVVFAPRILVYYS